MNPYQPLIDSGWLLWRKEDLPGDVTAALSSEIGVYVYVYQDGSGSVFDSSHGFLSGVADDPRRPGVPAFEVVSAVAQAWHAHLASVSSA